MIYLSIYLQVLFLLSIQSGPQFLIDLFIHVLPLLWLQQPFSSSTSSLSTLSSPSASHSAYTLLTISLGSTVMRLGLLSFWLPGFVRQNSPNFRIGLAPWATKSPGRGPCKLPKRTPAELRTGRPATGRREGGTRQNFRAWGGSGNFEGFSRKVLAFDFGSRQSEEWGFSFRSSNFGSVVLFDSRRVQGLSSGALRACLAQDPRSHSEIWLSRKPQSVHSPPPTPTSLNLKLED